MEIESEWTARKRERAAGTHSPQPSNCPTQAKSELEWATGEQVAKRIKGAANPVPCVIFHLRPPPALPS